LKTDAQIILYGSSLFGCALKETSMIDIDVQFNNTLPYDTLKELFHIIRDWGRKSIFSIDSNDFLFLIIRLVQESTSEYR
jgi:hypothetical protein